MKKRLTCLILTLAVLVSLFAAFPPEALAATTFGPFNTGNITWSVVIQTGDTAGTLYIDKNTASGTVGIPNYTRGSAPWYSHSPQVDKIVLEDGISSIGNWAFADFSRVTGIAVLGNITAIGTDTFRECTNLRGFYNSELSISGAPNLDFSALTTIGTRAFYNCYSLESLVFHNLNSLGAEAFVGTRSLSEIDAGTSGSIQTLSSDGILVGMNSATPPQAVRIIRAPVNLSPPLGVYTVPDTITTIEVEAFAYIDGGTPLTEVVLPASVTIIRDRAFAYIGTPNLGSPSSLTKATFMGDAPTSANFGSNVFFGISDSEFYIVYFPHGLRWTTPRWNGYRTVTNTSRITLDRYVIVMEKDTDVQLVATVYPSGANQDVDWATADAAIVTAIGKSHPNDPVAIISAVETGMTTITATAIESGAIAECTIIVLDRSISATTVLLDKSQITTSLSAAAAPELTAIVYPYSDNSAEQDQIARELVWSSSNPVVAIVDPGSATSLTRSLIIRSVGTTTITVATADGKSFAQCLVTVVGAPVFVPVTSVTLGISSVTMGSAVNLNDYATVLPANATFNTPSTDPGAPKVISWRVIPELTTVDVAQGADGALLGGNLSVLWGQTGTVVVEASVPKGRGDTAWGFSSDEPYTQRFTISVVSFIPVTNITGVPSLAFVGKQLQIHGTVNPANASFKEITWEMTGTTAGAHFDPVSRMLTAQWPGSVTMKATVANGRVDSEGGSVAYTQSFIVLVEPYITNTLTLNANPGGYMSPSGTRPLAEGEELTITATSHSGYVFSGWHVSNGGKLADANSATTVFTMPGNSTTVTAFFTYIGLPGSGAGGGGGGVVLPTPVHYFTNGSVYTRNSGVSFGHVTVRDYQFFSHVVHNGRTLTRGSHYTVSRVGGSTQVILANGYLDGLFQGAHTLTIHFTDNVSVSAVFSVLWESQVSNVYTDVFPSDWFYNNVMYVSQRGWMTSTTSDPGRFRPSNPATQGEVIDAIYRMAGSPTVLNMNNQVLQGRDAAYEWVRANAILPIGGFYNLTSAVSRQDMAVLFGRMVSVLRLRYTFVRNAPVFADEWQIDQVARPHVSDLFRAGIINGRSASTFDPFGVMTRAEFATFLRQFSEALGHWS